MKTLKPPYFVSTISKALGDKRRSGRLCSLALAMCGLLFSDPGTAAAESSFAGTTNMLVNDAWGDRDDRWQTASFQQSVFRRMDKSSRFDYLEWRGRARIVTPLSRGRRSVDRPYSGVYGFGVFAHNLHDNWYTSAGAELIIQGEQTRLHEVQETLHELASYENGYNYHDRNDPVVEDRVTADVRFEAGYALRPAPKVQIRPYAAARIGGNQAVSLGADVVIGDLAGAGTWNRDVVTGQLMTPEGSDEKVSFDLIAGFDVSNVKASIHLPESFGVEVEPNQFRARLGVRAGLGNVRFFVGQTWLSEQFVGQEEAQRVGTVSLSLGF